jgi:CPA2 family monovalent cation:H+ antiporter-2
MPAGGLIDLVVALAAAVVLLLAGHRLKLPSVGALLLAGVAIGPAGLGWVAADSPIAHLAEIGVVFLLFSIGLDLSLAELLRMRRAALVGGGIYVTLTGVAGAGVAAMFGASPRLALLAGFLTAISSTVVPLKLLGDGGELGAPHGRVVLGVALFQDLVAVPMLVLVPVLAGGGSSSGSQVALRLAASIAAVAAIVLVARRLAPRWLAAVSGTRSRELFLLAALLLCLGLAVATHALGLSYALGAFVAGLLLSESEYVHQAAAEIAPLRDVFASLFFVGIGMLLERRTLVELGPKVLLAALGILVLKTAAGYASVRFAGYPARTSWLSAVAMANIGEFSFVVAGAAVVTGLMPREGEQLFLGAAIASLLIAPFAWRAAPFVAARFPAGPAGEAPEKGIADHVVIVGYGVGGRNLARVLRETGIPYRIVELAPDLVRMAAAAGEPVLFGDATRREILEHAGVAAARVVVYAISDRAALLSSVGLARQLQPEVRIVARTRRIEEIEALHSAGADEVVAEEFESSIELFTRVLARFHVPRNVVEAEEKLLRGDRYRMFRSSARGDWVSPALLDLLAAGTVDLHRVAEGSEAAGRTLRDLELRRRTGGTVIALVRGREATPNPSPDLRLEAGDVLVLVGSHGEIDAAGRVLEGERARTELDVPA